MEEGRERERILLGEVGGIIGDGGCARADGR